MTQPWFPAPNPGGEHRKAMRTTIADWIMSKQILGLDEVLPTMRGKIEFDQADGNDSAYACKIVVSLDSDVESFGAGTGPDDFGGAQITYAVTLSVYHRQHDGTDWDGGQDDYDRIIDRVKDCFRGRGMDLGRPDFVLSAGAWPEGEALRHDAEEPVQDEEGGPVDRWGTIRLSAIMYLPSTYPQ